MRKAVFLGLCLGSAESLGGMEFGGGRVRTNSEHASSLNSFRNNRMRTFSEIPQEIQDKNLEKEQEALKIQRNMIKGNVAFRKKLIYKLQDAYPLNVKKSFVQNYGNFTFHREILDDHLFGRGRITHKHKIVTIEGRFYENFLDLRRKVKITRANQNKTYVFELLAWENKPEYQQVISIDDITRVERVFCYDGSLFLRFSGGNEGIAFNPEFVYKGELDNDEFTGKGTMIMKTGEILSGRFYRGVYKEKE